MTWAAEPESLPNTTIAIPMLMISTEIASRWAIGWTSDFDWNGKVSGFPVPEFCQYGSKHNTQTKLDNPKKPGNKRGKT